MTQKLADFMKNDTPEPTSTELQELSTLAQNQLSLQDEILGVEERLKSLKEELRVVQEEQIPDLMDSIGMNTFTLTSGYKVSINRDMFASVRKDKMLDAVAWLDSIGIGDIVKDQVSVDFGRGQAKDAAIVLAFCKNHNFSANEKLSIHPMTLKATCKEQLAKGVEFPEEFFSTGPIKKALIKK